MTHLLIEKRRFRSYTRCVFLVILFLLSQCGGPPQKQQKFLTLLTEEEKADLDYFFRILFFENYGAFVICGSKPLCYMGLFDPVVIEIEQQKWIAAMSNEERAKWEELTNGHVSGFTFERNPYHCWLTWQKTSKHLNIKNYILVVYPGDPGSYSLVFADIQKTTQVISENYDIFRNAVGFDFQPQAAVLELKNPDSPFWKKVFQLDNHVPKGLLFGFGKQNALLFEQELKHPEAQIFSSKMSIDTPVDLGKGNPTNFTIPLFGATSKEDEMVQIYKKEKEVIEKLYEGKDLVEVTLLKLSS